MAQGVVLLLHYAFKELFWHWLNAIPKMSRNLFLYYYILVLVMCDFVYKLA